MSQKKPTLKFCQTGKNISIEYMQKFKKIKNLTIIQKFHLNQLRTYDLKTIMVKVTESDISK